MGRLRRALRRRLPQRSIAWIRRLGRIRWLAKLGSLRAAGVSFRRQPRLALGYLLLDPEVDNYTYDLANRDELAPFLAAALGASLEEVEAFIREAESDPELNETLTRRIRWRFDTKRRLPLGRRVLWYATVRLLRPGLVVEAGVQEGLGTLVLLRALERNRLEGTPGRLIPVDPLMNAGWLVPRRMRAEWRFVNEPSETGLEAALSGERVDLLLSDSGGSYGRERSEYETAIRHASDRLVLIAGSGDQTSALPDVCAEHGFPYVYLQDRPAKHFFRGSGTGVAVARE